MTTISDDNFKKFWSTLKKSAGIKSSPWYKKADAAVSKYVENYQKAKKKAGEAEDAMAVDLLKVREACAELEDAFDKFITKKGLDAVTDADTAERKNIVLEIDKYRKQVEAEKKTYGDELDDRLRIVKGDVKKLEQLDAQMKLGKMGAVPGMDGPAEKIKSGQKPKDFDPAWWNANKPKDLSDGKLAVTMDFFWVHLVSYRKRDVAATDKGEIRNRINDLRQMSPGLSKTDDELKMAILACKAGSHDNTKAALKHYQTLSKAYAVMRKQYVTQEKTRATTTPAVKAAMDEILKGDPDY